MATYTDLHALRGSDGAIALRQKIAVAIAIKANTIAKNGASTAGAKAWAVAALRQPDQDGAAVFNYILAEYNTAATTAITGATDAQVQAAVDAAVNTLLGA